jgi:dipeptidyl aminopeptidase/acylaminoacyl peptidase
MLLWTNFGTRFRCVALLTMISLSGHAQSTLTPAQALYYKRIADLQFSPDGSKLVYVVYSYRWDWLPHICLLDVKNNAVRQITPENKSERSPQWSPDGKTLAFLSNRDGKSQVYTMPADGSEATAVTSRKYGATSFHWSPDGASIAYLAKDDTAPASDSGPQLADRESDLSRLWVIELASKTSRRVGKTGFRIDEFQWQNPSQILLAATDAPRVEEFNDAVYSVAIGDSTITLVSRPPQPFGNLLISPDGKRFAVRSTRSNGPGRRDLSVGTIARDDLRDISVPPDRTVAEARWHDPSAIWVRLIDGFRNRIWRLSPNGAPAPIDLPLSVDSFDVSRDVVMAYAGADFDHLPELYIRAKNGSIRQLTHLQEGWDGIHLASTGGQIGDVRHVPAPFT